MELESSSMERLSAIMSEAGKGNIREKATSTIKNQIEMHFHQEKMGRYNDKQKFRNELAETLFPCYRFHNFTTSKVEIEPIP
ncbi:MAG: hypothetical protein HON99_04230 [Crocinitomicaceae bacterium]|nr:hypothetical protein [Crocinitomicaceae bacterium]